MSATMTLSPSRQSKPLATVTSPSVVFLMKAISLRSAPIIWPMRCLIVGLGQVAPVRIVVPPVVAHVGHEAVDRLDHRQRHRRDRGVVQVGPPALDREKTLGVARRKLRSGADGGWSGGCDSAHFTTRMGAPAPVLLMPKKRTYIPIWNGWRETAAKDLTSP